jgi:hypothetical protein
LDEVAEGEVLVLERNGRRLVLRREESAMEKMGDVPDYGQLLRVPNAGSADSWSWEWTAPGQELVPSKEDGK